MRYMTEHFSNPSHALLSIITCLLIIAGLVQKNSAFF